MRTHLENTNVDLKTKRMENVQKLHRPVGAVGVRLVFWRARTGALVFSHGRRCHRLSAPLQVVIIVRNEWLLLLTCCRVALHLPHPKVALKTSDQLWILQTLQARRPKRLDSFADHLQVAAAADDECLDLVFNYCRYIVWYLKGKTLKRVQIT